MNSFHKGARAERQWANQLTEAGFPARRGRQFGSGSADNPDVISVKLGAFHFEVKNCQQMDPFRFFAQAARDASTERIPVVAMRRNGHPFLIIIKSEDFLRVLAACDLAALSGNGGKETA